jgi:hypothetical protein
MSVTPPHFKRGNGSEVVRISAMEEYLTRHEEFTRLRDDAVAKGQTELERRVALLEGWKLEVVVFIGMSKVRLGMVMFAGSIFAAVLTAAVVKWLHL